MKSIKFNQDSFLKYKPEDSTKIIAKYGKDNRYIQLVKCNDEFEIKFAQDEGSHILVELSQPLNGYSNWYAWKPAVKVNDDSPAPSSNRIQLNVPYKSQLDNVYSPYGTCNLTCAAMVCKFYGVAETAGVQLEDEMYEYCENYGLDRHYGETISSVIRVFGQKIGLKSDFTYAANWADIYEHLAAGNPGIIHGDFTNSGHIITVTGFNHKEKCFYVNDPYGEFIKFGNYNNRVDGEQLKYSYKIMQKYCGIDGDIWYHFISK